MIQVTTTENAFTFPEDIATYETIEITYAQNNKVILVKHKSDLTWLENTTYYIRLTQAETKRFNEGTYEVQVRIGINNSGTLEVGSSPIYRGRVYRSLNNTILEIQGGNYAD